MQDHAISTGEVARLFRVRPHTINRWVREGKLAPAFRTPGGHYRFMRSAIMAILVKDMVQREE